MKVKESADELVNELDSLGVLVKEQCTALDATLAQIDKYQQVLFNINYHKLINDTLLFITMGLCLLLASVGSPPPWLAALLLALGFMKIDR